MYLISNIWGVFSQIRKYIGFFRKTKFYIIWERNRKDCRCFHVCSNDSEMKIISVFKEVVTSHEEFNTSLISLLPAHGLAEVCEFTRCTLSAAWATDNSQVLWWNATSLNHNTPSRSHSQLTALHLLCNSNKVPEGSQLEFCQGWRRQHGWRGSSSVCETLIVLGMFWAGSNHRCCNLMSTLSNSARDLQSPLVTRFQGCFLVFLAISAFSFLMHNCGSGCPALVLVWFLMDPGYCQVWAVITSHTTWPTEWWRWRCLSYSFKQLTFASHVSCQR